MIYILDTQCEASISSPHRPTLSHKHAHHRDGLWNMLCKQTIFKQFVLLRFVIDFIGFFFYVCMYSLTTFHNIYCMFTRLSRRKGDRPVPNNVFSFQVTIVEALPSVRCHPRLATTRPHESLVWLPREPWHHRRYGGIDLMCVSLSSRTKYTNISLSRLYPRNLWATNNCIRDTF